MRRFLLIAPPSIIGPRRLNAAGGGALDRTNQRAAYHLLPFGQTLPPAP